MAKYFCGISSINDFFNVSIIDENLNIIFIDKLTFKSIEELLYKKSISVITIDKPIVLYNKYVKQANDLNDKVFDDIFKIKKRIIDNSNITDSLIPKELFLFNKEKIDILLNIFEVLKKQGFNFSNTQNKEKIILESYPNLICKNSTVDKLEQKKEFILNSSMRITHLFKNKNMNEYEINSLYLAYCSYLFFNDKCKISGSRDDGIVVFPNTLFDRKRTIYNISSNRTSNIKKTTVKKVKTNINDFLPNDELLNTSNITSNDTKPYDKQNNRISNLTVTEYCGAQYLYSKNDNLINIDDLRPIKSYSPLRELYDVKRIKNAELIINTTDGLKKVKANFVLSSNNCFRTAEEEDKIKMQNFLDNCNDRKLFIIKFNKIVRTK